MNIFCRLSVKKDGPNKGRIFYICPKPNRCKYFQWLDEIEESAKETTPSTSVASSNWGSGSRSNAPNTSSWGSRDIEEPSDKIELNCNCHKPANILTVRKEGPTKGKEFYTCANRDKPCGFFQWADETEQTNSRTDNSSSNWGSSSGNNTSNSWAADNNEKINCTCNKPASTLTVRKEGPNKGRQFYACPNREQSCGFFQWADETEGISLSLIKKC